MPYSELLKKAFNTVRHEPALWVLGMILALFGGGGGGGSGTSNFNVNSGDFGELQNLPNSSDFQAPPWFNAENLIPIALAMACVVIGLAILTLVIRSAALAGLIHGADRAAMGEDVHWRDLWRAGWSVRGRRILGLNILLALPALVIALLVVGVAALIAVPLIQSADAGVDTGALIGSILGGMAFVFCIVFILVIGGWVLSLIGNYAARSIVLEGWPVMESFGRGWRLFRRNLADTMVLSIMLGVIGIIVSFALGLLMILALFALGLPLFLFWRSQDFALTTMLLTGIPAVLLFIILSSVLYGPVLAFFETTWTVTWRYLTTPPEAADEVALAA